MKTLLLIIITTFFIKGQELYIGIEHFEKKELDNSLIDFDKKFRDWNSCNDFLKSLIQIPFFYYKSK